MGAWNELLTKLRLQKPQPAISRSDALRVRPIRNPDLKWELNEEGKVVVVLPRRNDLKGKLLTFFFPIPESRPVVLDEVGSFVWQRCDGQHSMNQLVKGLCAEYKLNPREIQVSLAEYMRMLGRRGMIAVAVPEELMADLGDATRRALKTHEVPVTSPPSAESDADESEGAADEPLASSD